jgi:hypothetical protein
VFPDDTGFLSPGDLEALDYLALSVAQGAFWKEEAIRFLSKPEVQQQIDRVAQALLERTKVSNEELAGISQFTGSLAELE